MWDGEGVGDDMLVIVSIVVTALAYSDMSGGGGIFLGRNGCRVWIWPSAIEW